MSESVQKEYIGKQSIRFSNPPIITGYASVVGKKENEGPLGGLFDFVSEDPMFGMKTWEEAESSMQKRAAELAIQKASLKAKDIRYLIGGDLLGQLIATSFGVAKLEIPMLGVFGACSTMGEAMTIGACLLAGGFADRVLSLTSSHFAGAEKEFRFPLAYGNQRPKATTWTVTGSGAVVLESSESNTANRCEPAARIRGVTIGKIVDYGLKDSMNMGACMAPAACDTIACFFKDFGMTPKDFDKIITGDLGMVGKDILLDFMKNEGYELSEKYMDCGIEIYDSEAQDTHSGGSGCGCSAVTLCAMILRKFKEREWHRVLFVPTGALLSTVSFNEGQTVMGIAHAVMLEAVKKEN